MASPHPFTNIKTGDLICITGWAPDKALQGTVVSFPIKDDTEKQFNLGHGESVIGIVSSKIKIKNKQFMSVLVRDKMILIGRGWVYAKNFSIGKILKHNPK